MRIKGIKKKDVLPSLNDLTEEELEILEEQEKEALREKGTRSHDRLRN